MISVPPPICVADLSQAFLDSQIVTVLTITHLDAKYTSDWAERPAVACRISPFVHIQVAPASCLLSKWHRESDNPQCFCSRPCVHVNPYLGRRLATSFWCSSEHWADVDSYCIVQETWQRRPCIGNIGFRKIAHVRLYQNGLQRWLQMRQASYNDQCRSTWISAQRDLTGVNAEKSDRTTLIEGQIGCSSLQGTFLRYLLARGLGANPPEHPTASYAFHPSGHPPDVLA